MRLKPKGGWRSSLFNIAILLAIFWLGVNIGNGRIDLQRPGTVSNDLPSSLDYAEVNQIYQSLKDNYDGKLDKEQLEEGLKHGLAAAPKDPYTTYFTPKEAQDFSNELNNSFSGIGAQLGLDKEGNVEVIAPIDGLPAAKAGLKAKDIIAAIDGTSTGGMSIDEAVSKIRGQAGTPVKLQIVRNRAQALEFTITRENINIPSVETKTLANNIGYIKVSNFSNDTVQLTQKAANQFKAQKVKGIVLDMRDNPGGLLDATIKVSSLWLEPGQTVLQEKRGGKVLDTDRATGGNVLKAMPTVVLINQGSASGSEIVAGALRDHKVAYLIGDKTYGKGVVQQLVNFRDGSQLKVTVASWYTPNGQNINKQGIKPDQTVKKTDTDTEAGKDPQLDAAQVYLNK